MHRYPMYAPPGGAFNDDVLNGIFVVVFLPFLLIAALFALYYLCKLIGWCWSAWRRPQRNYQREQPNPWQNQVVQWTPEAEEPPARKPPPRYVQQEHQFEAAKQLGPRSPVRLLYSAAFERVTDGELERIRCLAPDVIPRLHRAAQLLANRQTQEAEGLVVVIRGMIRRAFGDGKHWLEAIVLADIASFHHHRNQVEDAQYYFQKASQVAAPWMQQYPWLRNMATARRLIRSV